jgi:hypothetical protein
MSPDPIFCFSFHSPAGYYPELKAGTLFHLKKKKSTSNDDEMFSLFLSFLTADHVRITAQAQARGNSGFV